MINRAIYQYEILLGWVIFCIFTFLGSSIYKKNKKNTRIQGENEKKNKEQRKRP